MIPLVWKPVNSRSSSCSFFLVFLQLCHTMKGIAYLREIDWTTMRLKQLLVLHHLENFMRETLHRRLRMKTDNVRLFQTWVNRRDHVNGIVSPTLKDPLSILKLMQECTSTIQEFLHVLSYCFGAKLWDKTFIMSYFISITCYPIQKKKNQSICN